MKAHFQVLTLSLSHKETTEKKLEYVILISSFKKFG